VKAGTAIDGDFTNTAIVGSFSYDLDTVNNSSLETTTVLPSADLAIDLQSESEAVKPGSSLPYNVTVTNQGPSLAEGINVVLNLAPGVVYQSSSPGVCSSTSVVTCLLESITPHTNTQIRIISSVTFTTTQYLSTSATVSSGITFDPNPTNNSIE
jgi:uncharacterized repeat protein (TIGR01451 family)